MNDGITSEAAHDTHRSIELVAIDVDGTLLTSHHQLLDDTVAAVHEVCAQGIRVVLVSGRGKLPLTPILQRLGLHTPYIGSGGSYIADPVNDLVIERSPLKREDVVLVVQLARGKDVGIFFEETDRLIAEADAADLAKTRAVVSGVDVTEARDILQETTIAPNKMYLMGEHERLVSIEREIRRCRPELHLAYSEPIYLEITQSGVNKGNALKRLTAYLNVPLERIAVMGDGGNDISMFEVASLAIAMGNAAPEVKAAADVVAPSNDEGGVAWALRELILKR